MILRALLDCLFPPFCEVCEEPCRTRLLCPACWELCAPIDPKERCIHCFEEIEEAGLCPQCRQAPLLQIPVASVFERSSASIRLAQEAREKPEAIAAFLIFQWTRLHWEIPDAVIPHGGRFPLAKFFGEALSRPCILPRDVGLLEEDQILLLLAEENTPESLQEPLDDLNAIFPKKIYALTLFQ